jgi:hypothetical protein
MTYPDTPLRIEALREELNLANRRYDDFIEGLTAKLNAAGVPAMPSWSDAIDYLIRERDEVRACLPQMSELEVRLCEAKRAVVAAVAHVDRHDPRWVELARIAADLRDMEVRENAAMSEEPT